MKKFQMVFTFLFLIISLNAFAGPSSTTFQNGNVTVSGSTQSGKIKTDHLTDKLNLKDQLKLKYKGIPDFKMGDWNSSGAPEMPYEPPYPYQYHCQAQLTDSVQQRDQRTNENFLIYAIAEFEFNNEQTYVESDRLVWYGKKFYSTHKVTDFKKDIPFQTDGQSFSLGFRPRDQIIHDEVSLYARIRQVFGSVVFSTHDEKKSVRSSSDITLSVSLDVEDLKEQRLPAMSLRILCSKIK